jgi:hypothetical protein
MPYRLLYALSYYWPKLTRIIGWVFRSREFTNFSYEVTDISKDYTADTVSLVTGIASCQASRYIAEFYETLEELRIHVQHYTPDSPDRYTMDLKVKPGRRIIYYALARALKPRLIVEAGVAQGLGTCILATAVRRNLSEGFSGRIISVDLSPSAGHLIKPPYAGFVYVWNGDILQFLENELKEQVNFYIHDTSGASENSEYDLVERRLSEDAVVLSTWHTRAIMNLARRSSRNYMMFCDEPMDHWYPGCRIGLAFKFPKASTIGPPRKVHPIES